MKLLRLFIYICYLTLVDNDWQEMESLKYLIFLNSKIYENHK